MSNLGPEEKQVIADLEAAFQQRQEASRIACEAIHEKPSAYYSGKIVAYRVAASIVKEYLEGRPNPVDNSKLKDFLESGVADATNALATGDSHKTDRYLFGQLDTYKTILRLMESEGI